MKTTINATKGASLKTKIVSFGTATVFASTVLVSSAGAVSATQATNQQTHIQTIITKGDQEISRRLTSLSTLTSKINAATKLTASDKTTLTNEVSSTTSGLTALKSKLDTETTLDGARSDAQDIYSQYRVYALVTPKVHLVKVADDVQVTDTKLTTLAQKLQTRITAAQNSGKDVTALQAKLSDMTSKANSSQATASQIESGVINLQPTDYDSNHAVLSGDSAKLKTAHSDNQAAYADAKSIVSSLKTLK